MKILMVAIPNHHFFQWVDQLKESGYEVYWFDITDGGPKVERIGWVNQIKDWKLRSKYPFRHYFKRSFPSLYSTFHKILDRKPSAVFQRIIEDIQPDIVHCFEMRLAGFPILDVMAKYPKLPFVYSSWGSDIFFYNELGITREKFSKFLGMVNFLITDCKRDYRIAVENGFSGDFLGNFIGNGGLDIHDKDIEPLENRKTIIIKGYEDGVGKALKIIEAMELLPKEIFNGMDIVIYSAEKIVQNRVESSVFFKDLNVKIYPRGQFIANSDLLKIMGSSHIHIANSISDGLPTSGVEAMGMGAFPIQSNPGNVSEEVIQHEKNGYLILNPLDAEEIANLIKNALKNEQLRKSAQEYNVAFVRDNFNRKTLQPKIIQLYKNILA